MKLIMAAVIFVILLSLSSVAQDARNRTVVLNNGQYTISYNPRDLTGIIQGEKKQNAEQTQAMLWLHYNFENSDYGLLKSGNIKRKTVENARGEETPILEISNRTIWALFENDFVMINGTFKIKKGGRREITTNEGTRAVQTSYFELDRNANLELRPDRDQKLIINCKDERCKRIVGFGDAEEIETTANWLNIRGEANITLGIENQESAGITVRNIAGILPIAGETESLGRAIIIYGIPYLDRNPGSLLAWNKIKSEMPVKFLQTYGNNGQVLKSGMQSPTFDRINVYDTCATPNCWFTTFLSESGAPVAFFLENSPILQLLAGKMAFVKQDNLYSGCLLERGVTCVKSDETGNNLKISLTGDSRIKIEAPPHIRKLNFERLIEDDSEVVVEDNGKRLKFNKDGVKYSGPDGWHSLKTSFSIREMIGGKRRLLECNAETRKCYVDGNETLSPELRSCTSNDECGPEEKCSDNLCIKNTWLCSLYKGNEGESERRGDMLVMNDNVNNLEGLKRFVDGIIFGSGGMFAVAPFNSETNQNAYNIWIQIVQPSRNIFTEATNNWQRGCPVADYLILFSDNLGSTRAFNNGVRTYVPTSVVGIAPNAPGGAVGVLKRTITHEVGGHAIGDLVDEYTRYDVVRHPSERTMSRSLNCAKSQEEAETLFGQAIAEEAITQGWTGCGGDCNWDEYHCDMWYVSSPMDQREGVYGTLTVMGDQGYYSEFSPFDQRIIQEKINRRLA